MCRPILATSWIKRSERNLLREASNRSELLCRTSRRHSWMDQSWMTLRCKHPTKFSTRAPTLESCRKKKVSIGMIKSKILCPLVVSSTKSTPSLIHLATLRSRSVRLLYNHPSRLANGLTDNFSSAIRESEETVSTGPKNGES